MNRWDCRSAVTSCVAMALLAGCGGMSTAQPGALPIGATVPQGRAHKASGSGGDLLYVTSANGIVIVSYPKWQIVATIPGTNNGGVCSDPNNGNVYVTQPSLSQIVVYAHGGTTPIDTLSSPAPYSEIYSCSVDPLTGDLAAIGLDRPDNTSVILVYAKGQGAATIYKSNKISVFYTLTYANTGNIIAEGSSSKTGTHLVRLSAKKKQFSFIFVYGTFYIAKLQWDGKYIATVSYNEGTRNSTLYQVEISGSTGRVINTTTLYNTVQNYNFCLDGASLIAFFGRLKRDNNQALATWPYPAGGRKTSRFYGVAKGPGNRLIDLALSVAPSRN